MRFPQILSVAQIGSPFLQLCFSTPLYLMWSLWVGPPKKGTKKGTDCNSFNTRTAPKQKLLRILNLLFCWNSLPSSSEIFISKRLLWARFTSPSPSSEFRLRLLWWQKKNGDLFPTQCQSSLIQSLVWCERLFCGSIYHSLKPHGCKLQIYVCNLPGNCYSPKHFSKFQNDVYWALLQFYHLFNQTSENQASIRTKLRPIIPMSSISCLNLKSRGRKYTIYCSL